MADPFTQIIKKGINLKKFSKVYDISLDSVNYKMLENLNFKVEAKSTTKFLPKVI